MNERKWDPTIGPWVEEYATFAAYEKLDGEKNARALTKGKFLSGEIENPVLDYPNVDTAELDARKAQLLAFRDLIIKDVLLYPDEHPSITTVDELGKKEQTLRLDYLFKINEKIAEIGLLKTTAEIKELQAQPNYDPEKLEKLANKFKKFTEFVYGKPSLDVFRRDFEALRNLVATATESPNTHIKSTAETLNGLLKANTTGSNPPILTPPSQEVFAQVKNQTENELGNIIPKRPEDKLYSSQEVKEFFVEALKNLQAEGWEVLIDDTSGRTAMHVSQEQRKVVIPDSRTYTLEAIKSLRGSTR